MRLHEAVPHRRRVPSNCATVFQEPLASVALSAEVTSFDDAAKIEAPADCGAYITGLSLQVLLLLRIVQSRFFQKC